jgi:hypothetical protein
VVRAHLDAEGLSNDCARLLSLRTRP